MNRPTMLNLFDRATSVALKVPADWSVTAETVFPLDCYAPAEDGYRASFGVSRIPISAADRATFEALIVERVHELRNGLDDYRLIDEAQLFIDGLPAYRQHYRWQVEASSPGFTQLFALVLAGPDSVVEIHAATLTPHAGRYLPLFDEMLQSLRVITVIHQARAGDGGSDAGTPH